MRRPVAAGAVAQIGFFVGKPPIGVVVAVQGKADLLEVVGALQRAADSRTFCTAGTSRAIRMAMMAITTNSSISVKPLLPSRRARFIAASPQKMRKRRLARPASRTGGVLKENDSVPAARQNYVGKSLILTYAFLSKSTTTMCSMTLRRSSSASNVSLPSAYRESRNRDCISLENMVCGLTPPS